MIRLYVYPAVAHLTPTTSSPRSLAVRRRELASDREQPNFSPSWQTAAGSSALIRRTSLGGGREGGKERGRREGEREGERERGREGEREGGSG